jgi:hypothetical protein
MQVDKGRQRTHIGKLAAIPEFENLQVSERIEPSCIGHLVAAAKVEHTEADKGRQRGHIAQPFAKAEVERVQVDKG